MRHPYKPRFPHFKPEEARIMERFLKRGILQGKYTFDYRLNVPIPKPPLGATTEEHAVYAALKQKRIDAICEQDKQIWIIEVKDRLRPSALGQLLVYHHLYLEQAKPHKPVKLAIVTEKDDPAVHQVCKHHNIHVYIV